jgi:hypothetical protein
MQTFLPYESIDKVVKCLDDKRLGKQRIEAIQIARALLNISEGWKNHPAVKMWKGYEAYLVIEYLKKVMDEWKNRGYKNTKCEIHYEQLIQLIDLKTYKKPEWLNEKFCISHQSNLLRKKPEYYKKYFNVQDDLEYIWPE